ncbi:MAG: VWA domain-containing protein [Parachlamydiaceae bacterium]
MFQFYFPWFALLLPLPFLVRRLFPGASKAADVWVPEINFSAPQRLKNIFPTHHAVQKQSNPSLMILLSLAWIGLVVALMQPEKVDQFLQVKNKGYDIMLAVDISGSMQAVDFSTQTKIISRLDVTKEVVGKFALGRQGDRVGLVTFGEKAYLHVPLTLDTLSVSKMLNGAVAGMAGNATAIGDAIGLSVRTLRDRPEGSRVLVLLTDGEDNASSIPPLEAAKLAKQYGIRIYTIGVGRNGPVPYPTRSGGYGMIEVPIDEKLLKEIALMTGGRYFQATDKQALESIYGKINQLEKTEANESVYLMREPLYYYPLGMAMVCLLSLALWVGIRRVAHGS